jgi:hypothetical protein
MQVKANPDLSGKSKRRPMLRPRRQLLNLPPLISSVGWNDIKSAHKRLTPRSQIQLLRHSSKTAAGAFCGRFSRLLLNRFTFESLVCVEFDACRRSIQRTAAALSLDPLKVAAYVKVHALASMAITIIRNVPVYFFLLPSQRGCSSVKFVCSGRRLAKPSMSLSRSRRPAAAGA